MIYDVGIISLFSGSGQLDRAVADALRHFGFRARTLVYVEESAHAQAVIRARIRDGLLDDAPIWSDVCTFAGARLRGFALAIVAGFPCQPFSLAGKRAGSDDERYLFGEVVRIALEAGCEILFLENVPGLLIPDVRRPDEPAPISDVSRLLAESGFDCAWLPLAAEDVGAPHGRERWWAIAWREVSRGGYTRDGGDATRERPTLEGQARQLSWATPRAEDAECAGSRISRGVNDTLYSQTRAWGTPRADEYKGTGPKGSKSQQHQLDKGYLNAQVEEIADTGKSSESLNADWEELLMGWPIGWSDPDRNCDSVFPGWPTGQTFEQFAYEPPRTRPRAEMMPASKRNARVKMLGNGVVPQCATSAFIRLLSELGVASQ